MITYKSTLNKKQQSEVSNIINNITDLFGDFYLTKDGIRLSISENLNLLFSCLRKGDKIAYGEEGVAIVYGYSDRAKRKYLKILAEEPFVADKLIKIITWNLKNIDLWIKVKRKSNIRKVLKRNGFRFKGNRGSEVLYMRSKK